MTDAMRVAEEVVSAANVTTCDGYYEVDIDKTAAVIERAIADAVAEREARIVAWLRGEHEGAAWDDGEFFAKAIERGDHKERAN